MAGEYPKLIQQVDFLKLRVEQLEEQNKALKEHLKAALNGEYAKDLPHTKYYDSEIVEDE